MIVKFCLVSAVLALNGCFSKAAPVDSGNLRSLQEASDDDNVACSYYFDGPSINNYTATNEGASSELLCGSFGPPKCCDWELLNNVKDGSGPFAVEYEGEYTMQRGQGAASREAAICYAYIDELQASICLRNQATFLVNTTLAVCEASCNAIYDACIPTGIISTSFAEDGTSFCEAAFRSGTSTEDESGYFSFKQTTLSVVVGTEDCALLTEPTEDVIDRYEDFSMDIDTCTATGIAGMAVWLLAVIVVVGCCGFCCCVGIIYYCCCKK